MFISIQRRLKARRSSKSKQEKADQASVFRSQKSNGRPFELNPTFSVDSEVASITTTTASHSVVHENDGFVVTTAMEAERAQHKLLVEANKDLHDQLVEKDEEISGCTVLLKTTEGKLDQALASLEAKNQAIAELEEQLSHKKTQLQTVEAELDASKAQLHIVSSVLVRTQELLYEKMEQLGLLEGVSEFGKGILQFFSKP